MPDYEFLKVTRDGPVAVCTIVNPPQNFMNARMVQEFLLLADEVEADDAVRVLVLTGGVEGIFITHYDVSELAAVSAQLQQVESFQMDELHATHQAFNRFQALPKPVIAAINGVAGGGGCELALACDFRFMARAGFIGQPEVLVGILPGAGGTQRMARLLGTAKALEMILMGRLLSADEAESIGLIHKAFDPPDLMPGVMAFARALAERPPVSVAQVKRCIHEGVQLPLLQGLKLEQDCFWETMRSPDALRLMKDYVEGRYQPLEQTGGTS
jgi:enoyl-CoA hydratase/carnithine racemase